MADDTVTSLSPVTSMNSFYIRDRVDKKINPSLCCHFNYFCLFLFLSYPCLFFSYLAIENAAVYEKSPRFDLFVETAESVYFVTGPVVDVSVCSEIHGQPQTTATENLRCL